jgi:autotransporter-associated beta strand protein
VTSKTILATVLATGLSAVWAAMAAGPAQAEDWSPLWSTTTLSLARGYVGATSCDGKVFFGGGCGSSGYTNVVDIFDAATLTRTTTTLSHNRYGLEAASVGGKVFFGGGESGSGYTNVVDIFDAATLARTSTTLPQGRSCLAAASAGGKVIFAGGYYGSPTTNRVDILDAATLTLTTSSLSQARAWLVATSSGSKVFFGGGVTAGVNCSDRVDVYDTATSTWATTSLSQPREFLEAASAGGKVLFGGGLVNNSISGVVDIFDADTLAHTTASLTEPRYYLAATSAGGKVFFAGGTGIYNYGFSSVVDIYDTASGTWSIDRLSQARFAVEAASAGNRVFFAGGCFDVGSAGYSNVVDIYTIQNYGTITSSQAFTLVDQTTVAGRMQLSAPGSLNLGTFNLAAGSMSGNAPINLGSRTLSAGGDGTSSIYSGAISGHGGLTKTGAGMLTLSGTSSYDGTTRVSGGVLKVTGSVAASSVLVNGGTLQGTGRVGAITGTSGHLHPGGSPGILASGSLAMSQGFSFDVSLDGPAAGTGYSQLDVTGTVDLGGASLGATLGYIPAFYSGGGSPDYLYIVKNDGADPVTGQFAGLPQMSQFDLLFNGTAYKAQISYQGDFATAALTGGNDVVVALPEPATLTLLALGGLLAMRRRKGK